jgi:hypothetical protein
MTAIITMSPAERRSSGSAGTPVPLDYRERRELEALERENLKRHEHAEQSAAQNSAGTRIRAWERLHQLCMPSMALHPILEIIAGATQLSLAQVQDEQRLRAVRRASANV